VRCVLSREHWRGLADHHTVAPSSRLRHAVRAGYLHHRRGRGREGDRREPRPARSGRHRGSWIHISVKPHDSVAAPDDGDSSRRQPGVLGADIPYLDSRSSPSAPQGRPCAQRPRAIPGRGRTPPRDRPQGRTPGRWPGPGRRGRSGGCGPGRWAAAGSGCSEHPHDYSSSALTEWQVNKNARRPACAATGTPCSHPSRAQNWPIGRRTARCQRALINVRRLLSRAWPVPCSVAGPCIAVMGMVPGSA
jgi:hypothetical protein